MPDEDGYAVVNKLRLIEAQYKLPLAERMPAIALTAYIRPQDRMRALFAGFQMHIPSRSIQTNSPSR